MTQNRPGLHGALVHQSHSSGVGFTSPLAPGSMMHPHLTPPPRSWQGRGPHARPSSPCTSPVHPRPRASRTARLKSSLITETLWALSLLTSFEGKFVRFSCLVVVESPDRLPRLAVVCQDVLAVIFVKLLVIKWIGILRTVTEILKQLVI